MAAPDQPTAPGATDPKDTTNTATQQPAAAAAAAKPSAVGEDDEFEDFPVEDWDQEESEGAGQNNTTKHLWEESWDDDDTTDDFSTQLKYVVTLLPLTRL
jgi:26 proteasome complex subunit DSS1